MMNPDLHGLALSAKISVMKNTTSNVGESLTKAARERAPDENTTLNAQFRLRLAEHSRKRERLRAYDETIRVLRGRLVVGRKLTREETNER